MPRYSPEPTGSAPTPTGLRSLQVQRTFAALAGLIWPRSRPVKEKCGASGTWAQKEVGDEKRDREVRWHAYF